MLFVQYSSWTRSWLFFAGVRRPPRSPQRRSSAASDVYTRQVVLPATVALLVLAGPLTVVIFHYGKFDEQDVRMSTLALMAYSIGLMGFSMVKVLAPGYFARQDTKTTVKIGVQSLVLPFLIHISEPTRPY